MIRGSVRTRRVWLSLSSSRTNTLCLNHISSLWAVSPLSANPCLWSDWCSISSRAHLEESGGQATSHSLVFPSTWEFETEMLPTRICLKVRVLEQTRTYYWVAHSKVVSLLSLVLVCVLNGSRDCIPGGWWDTVCRCGLGFGWQISRRSSKKYFGPESFHLYTLWDCVQIISLALLARCLPCSFGGFVQTWEG